MTIQKIDEKIPDVISKNESLKRPINISITFSIPESVLQILKDLGCPPPEAVFTLEKKITDLKALSHSATHRLVLFGIVLVLGAAIVLAVAAIALAIFGYIFSGIVVLICAAVVGEIAQKKFLSISNESIKELVKTIKLDLNLIGEWGKQLGEKAEEDNLTKEKKETLLKTRSFCILLLKTFEKKIME